MHKAPSAVRFREAELKKSEGYFFKEAQAAPLHERGPAALSKKILLLAIKEVI